MSGRAVPTCWLVLAMAATTLLGQGWVGQGRVNRPNGDTLDGDPTSAVDHGGRPWVVWIGRYGDTTLLWSRWLDTRWAPQRGVSGNSPSVWQRFRPDITFDERGRTWLAWHNGYENNNRDIAASYWDSSQWTPEQQVNQSDSTDLDFAPAIACGGGQVWCVWYGGPTDMSPYSVFASRWDPMEQCWEPEMRVSPLRPEQWQWWCDVAVDGEGTPHVVWVAVPACTVYYSYYEAGQWQGPFPVNDSMVRAASWADPHIVIDNDAGMMHVSYTGVARGATGRDVFYTRNDGSGWAPSVRVTKDTLPNYDEWYSDIGADRPSSVWVVWDRQGEGPDQFRVYASHYDGSEWSPEERLDNDSAYYDVSPDISLGVGGRPWVVWSGTVAGASDDIWSNHQGDTVAFRCKAPGAILHSAEVWAASPTRPPVRIHFRLQRTGPVRLGVRDVLGREVAVLVDRIESAGDRTVGWNGRPGVRRAAGVYFAVLEVRGERSNCRFEVP